MQAPQRLPWVDAELTGEQVAGPPVGGQRLGLPAAAIQRQHELAVQPFPQRILGGQLLQLAGERVMPAKRQVRLDPRLEGGEPQFLQAGRLRPGEGVVSQVGQHATAPQLQRPAQRPGGFGVPARVQRGPPRREPVLEHRRIQVLAAHPQQVTAVPGDQDVARGAPGPPRIQRLAQMEHVGLQGGGPPLGWVPAPHLFGQPVHRDDPVGLQQQQRRARPAAADRPAAPHTRTAKPPTARECRTPQAPSRLTTASAAITHPARFASPAARASGSRPFHHQARRRSTAVPSHQSKPSPRQFHSPRADVTVQAHTRQRHQAMTATAWRLNGRHLRQLFS